MLSCGGFEIRVTVILLVTRKKIKKNEPTLLYSPLSHALPRSELVTTMKQAILLSAMIGSVEAARFLSDDFPC